MGASLGQDLPWRPAFGPRQATPAGHSLGRSPRALHSLRLQERGVLVYPCSSTLAVASWLNQEAWGRVSLPSSKSGASLMSQTVESACNAGDLGSIPAWVRKIPCRRKWQTTPVLLPGKFHGWRSPVGNGPWDHKESGTTERFHFHFHFLAKLGSPLSLNSSQWNCYEAHRRW